MPNPLTLTPSTHTAAPKPETEQRSAEKSTRFQDVMENEDPTIESDVEVEEDAEVELDVVVSDTDDVPTDRHQVSAETPEPPENRGPVPVPESIELNNTAREATGLPTSESNPVVQNTQAIGKGAHDPIPTPDTAKIETPQHALAHPGIEAAVQKTASGSSLLFPVPTHPTHQPNTFEPTRLTKNRPLPDRPGPNPTVAQPHVQERIPTMAQVQVMVSAQAQETDTTGSIGEVDGVLAPRDAALPQNTRESVFATLVSTQSARADVTRAIAGQTAAAIQQRSGSGVVEIALNPEELGRVSIVLNGREDGLHMSIAAERPETLDLMRRHISVLASEFQKLGYGDISFDLGTSADAQHDSGNSKTGSFGESQLSEEDGPTGPVVPRIGPGRGIDMRL